MISRLLALIAFPIMAYFFTKSISQRYSLSSRQNTYLFVLVCAFLVIGVLIIMGRLPFQFILAPLGVAATFLLRMLPTLLRLLPMWQMFKSRTASSRPRSNDQSSTIRTEYFEMELRHATGSMDGVVVKGLFSKKRLSSLALAELMDLLAECSIDMDSSQVLEAYIDRNHPDWRDQVSDTGTGGRAETGLADESAMTEKLALEILGLQESVSRDEVIKAHRMLMQKMHPDRGGSDYLAKKINAAKDYLLNNLS